MTNDMLTGAYQLLDRCKSFLDKGSLRTMYEQIQLMRDELDKTTDNREREEASRKHFKELVDKTFELGGCV